MVFETQPIKDLGWQAKSHTKGVEVKKRKCLPMQIEILGSDTPPWVKVVCGSCGKTIITTDSQLSSVDEPGYWRVIDYLVVKEAVKKHLKKKRKPQSF